MLCVFIAALSRFAVYASPLPYEDKLAELLDFGVRLENGQAERATLEYIEKTLRDAGLTPELRDFSSAREGYSQSRIVEAVIPGIARDELVLVAPLDSWHDAPSGAGGAAGIAFALAEAERASARRGAGSLSPLTLRFVFLGAERRGRKADGEEASLGTRTWLASLPQAPSRAVLYLSLDAGCSSIVLRNAARKRLSPYWHFDRTYKALAAAGIVTDIEANRLQIYRLGLADRYGPAAPYLEAGVPAAELDGVESAQGAKAIGGVQFSAFLDALVASYAGGFPDTWDLHYLAFELGHYSFTIRETSYLEGLIAFFALASAILLSFTVTRRKAAKPLIARVPKVLWQTVALFAALVCVYLAGDAVSKFDAFALGSRDAWLLAPRIFAGARVLSSFLLFLALISLLVERNALTANPLFYEFAALLCLVVDVLTFSAIDLPMSFPFLWALAIVALSLVTRKAWATIGAYCLMYLPLILLAAELAKRPELAVYRRVLAPGVSGSLFLAALALPFFVFTVSPLLFFAPRGALARTRMAAIFTALAFAAEGGALAVAIQQARPSSAKPTSAIIRTISESIDQDNALFEATLSGIGRLGEGKLFRGSDELPYAASGDSLRLTGQDAARRISMSESRSFFLGRCTDKVRIAFAEPPFMVRLTLRGSSELGIYDCSLPYSVSLDGSSAQLFAQANPGAEFSFDITVSEGFSADLEVKAEYLEAPVTYSFPDGSVPKGGNFVVRSTTRLSGER